MTAIPVRVFGTSAAAFRAGPGGSNLWRAQTGAPPATVSSTIIGFGIGTGSRQVKPGVTNSTAGSAGAAATNIGWRDESYSHTNQNINPCRLSGQWAFVYEMSGGIFASIAQMTVVVYAVTAGNVARELFRNTSGNIVVLLGKTNFSHIFTPIDVDLVADEILQYEFFLNLSTNGNLITGTSVIFTAGARATAPNADPTVTGGTIVAVLTRGAADSAPLVGAAARLKGAFRIPAETITTSSAVERAFVGARDLSESVSASSAVGRVYGAIRGLTESILIGADAIARALVLGRAAAESAPAVVSLARSFIGARGVSGMITTSSFASRILADAATGGKLLRGRASRVTLVGHGSRASFIGIGHPP